MDPEVVQAGLGAVIGERAGAQVVLSYGNPSVEARALATGAGVIHRPGRATWHVTGKDRVSYLHRMLTQDVKGIETGRARYACLLDVRGRILGDLLVLRHEDRHVLDLAKGAVPTAMPVLEKYVIADDVAFEDATAATARFTLAGPAAPAVLEALRVRPPEPWAFAAARIGASSCHVLRRDLGPRPSFELFAPAQGARDVLDALRAGAVLCGEEAWDVARVETGVPAFGAELGPSVTPNEALLEEALSWSKGCYPGQEPVVMARHRGHPATLLVRLAFDAPEPPPPGAALSIDGKPVGRVTTAARGVMVPGVLGLGYVRHGLAAAGTEASVEGGGTARVRAPD
jgi:folate-binding protein YgfZ